MIASMASASAAVAERMARPSGKRDIRRVFLLHADGVIARVDMVGFAGDVASEIAQQIERRAADTKKIAEDEPRANALQRRVEELSQHLPRLRPQHEQLGSSPV